MQTDKKIKRFKYTFYRAVKSLKMKPVLHSLRKMTEKDTQAETKHGTIQYPFKQNVMFVRLRTLITTMLLYGNGDIQKQNVTSSGLFYGEQHIVKALLAYYNSTQQCHYVNENNHNIPQNLHSPKLCLYLLLPNRMFRCVLGGGCLYRVLFNASFAAEC